MNADFQDRMEAGKQVAAARRARGLHTGKSAKGWDTVKRRGLDPWEQRFEEIRLRFHSALDAARELQVPAPAFDPETEIPF